VVIEIGPDIAGVVVGSAHGVAVGLSGDLGGGQFGGQLLLCCQHAVNACGEHVVHRLQGLLTSVLVVLKERYYSAVMSATGLLYLAILTAFGTDLVARAVLAA